MVGDKRFTWFGGGNECSIYIESCTISANIGKKETNELVLKQIAIPIFTSRTSFTDDFRVFTANPPQVSRVGDLGVSFVVRSMMHVSSLQLLRAVYNCCGLMLDCDLAHDDVIKWKHFSALLVICAGNSQVPGEFPTKASDALLWCFLWFAPE